MKGEKETSRQDLVKQLHFLDIPLEETYNFNGSFRNFAFAITKGANHMAEISPDHDLGPQSGNPSTLTGLLSAEYTCPICDAVVIRIVGNTFQYLRSHFTEPGDENGYYSLVMSHRDMSKPPEYVPPRIREKPFLTVKSSTMTS
jgi:hypothetical protein